MALAKTPFSWPIQGGLATKIAPLSVQPGSALVLDNVIQERLNEWRRRQGFTQVAADTVPQAAGPFMVANSGTLGMVSLDHQSASTYQAAATSSKWKADAAIPGASNLARTPMARSEDFVQNISFASDGTNHIFTRVNSNSVRACLFDSSSGAESEVAFGGSSLFTACAAGPAGYLVAFACDSGGNLRAVVANTLTGTLGASTVIKAGLSVAAVFDAHYYGGSTVTIVARMTAGGYQFIEFDPATGVLVVDSNKAVGTVTCLSCIMEPSGSGRRFIAFSTAASTQLQVLNAAGVQQDLQTLEAVASTQITGCANNSGLNAACVYQTATALRRNTYSAGAVGAPANVNGIVTLSTTVLFAIESQGWGEPGDTKWFFIVGANCITAGAAQFTPILVANTFTAGDPTLHVMAPITPLQGVRQLQVGHHLNHAVRTGARAFAFGMPVFVHYAEIGLSVFRDIQVCAFTHTLLSSAEAASAAVGRPAYRGQSAILPLGALRSFDGGPLAPIGLMCPPAKPGCTPSVGAGVLTLLGQYQWCIVVETEDLSGNIWRSPPSVPVEVILTGGQNTAVIAFPTWQMEYGWVGGSRLTRVKLYRTMANGSQFRLVDETASNVAALGDISFTDAIISDVALASSEILYTGGEVENACWPASSHCWMHDDRLWSVNRDFRTEINYSKNLQANRAPETTDTHVIDIDDEFGDITNGCSAEGRGIVFKRNAIYFVTGKGFDNAGAGENYEVTRVSQDVGSLPGSPIVVAGDTVYFVCERGIYSIDTQGQDAFVGAGVDQYLNQPQIQTPETVYDGCFLPDKDEVRFVTTNYILVYSRTFKTWTRWTGLSGMRRCLVVNGRMVLFKNDGTVWREGDETQTTDQGVAFTGVIRSPWFRSKDFGQIRLFRGLATATRTAGGANLTPTMNVYTDDSEVAVDSWQPQAPIAGATSVIHMEARPAPSDKQNCSSFSIEVVLPSGDTTFRIEKLGAEIGLRPGGAQKRPDSERWQ